MAALFSPFTPDPRHVEPGGGDRIVGQWRSTQSSQVPMLRRENWIRTIQASLAIEHNTLSLDRHGQ